MILTFASWILCQAVNKDWLLQIQGHGDDLQQLPKSNVLPCIINRSFLISLSRCLLVGWLRRSSRLHSCPCCWRNKHNLGGTWHRQLWTSGLHQRQETISVYPRFRLQWLDRQQHQEVYLWKRKSFLKLTSLGRDYSMFRLNFFLFKTPWM